MKVLSECRVSLCGRDFSLISLSARNTGAWIDVLRRVIPLQLILVRLNAIECFTEKGQIVSRRRCFRANYERGCSGWLKFIARAILQHEGGRMVLPRLYVYHVRYSCCHPCNEINSDDRERQRDTTLLISLGRKNEKMRAIEK